MTIREKFIEKIEGEYQTILDSLSEYDCEDIAIYSQNTATYQAVYKFLCDNKSLTDDQMNQLMEVEPVIVSIANQCRPIEEEVHKKYLDRCNYIIEAMDAQNKAIDSINKIVKHTNINITMKWLDYFREIAVDSGYINDHNPYDCLVDAFKTVSKAQGEDILQQLYDMGENHVIFDNYLIEAAKYLADGGNIEKIPEMASEGMFEEPYEDIKDTLEQEQQGGMDLC